MSDIEDNIAYYGVNQLITLSCKVMCAGDINEVKSNGKTLQKQEYVVADSKQVLSWCYGKKLVYQKMQLLNK